MLAAWPFLHSDLKFEIRMFIQKYVPTFILSLLFIIPQYVNALDSHRTISNLNIDEYQLETSSGLPVKYFVSTGKPNLPLIIYIQGSGCKPVINGSHFQGGSSVYDFLPTALGTEFNAMVVDKPYALSGLKESDSKVNFCSKEFNANFTFDAWFDVLDTAFRHASKNADFSISNVSVIGFSEGAVMASALASKHENISNLALIGVTGANQVFDFISLAHSQNRVSDIDLIVNQVNDILSSPTSSESFAWGHSYKRWASFFKALPSKFLENTKARIYLASGTNDQSVPIQSTELLYTKLLLQGSDVSFRRVIGGEHNLLKNGDSWDKLSEEYLLIKTWLGN